MSDIFNPSTGGGGSGSPGGSSGQVQYNNGGNFGGASQVTINPDGTLNAPPEVIAVTATSKTLALTDANTVQDCNNAAAQTISAPLNATVAFPVNTTIVFEQNGVGQVTVIGVTGVTINGVNGGSYSIPSQYTTFYLRQESTNVWYAEGGVAFASTGTGSVVRASGATTTNLTVGTQSTTDNSALAASTAYVTTAVANAVAGVNPAISVNAATIQASDTSGLTYNNGVSGIGATFTGSVNTALTVDGFTFTTLGQRLLVKNDTQSPSGAFNGIFNVTQIQTAILPPILTRALDYDTPSDMNNTGAIPVINGTVNKNTSWLMTSTIVTVGTTPLTYVQFSYAPSTIQSGLFASKPGSAVAGQQYFATDLGSTGVTIVYTGSLWKPASGVAVIYQNAVAVTHTGDTNNTLLSTVTIPAGLLSANGGLRITERGICTGTAGAKTFRIYFNATSGSISSTAILSHATTSTILGADATRTIYNVNSVSVQSSESNLTNDTQIGDSSGAPIGLTVNTAAASYINFAVQLANSADSAGINTLTVEWLEP